MHSDCIANSRVNAEMLPFWTISSTSFAQWSPNSVRATVVMVRGVDGDGGIARSGADAGDGRSTLVGRGEAATSSSHGGGGSSLGGATRVAAAMGAAAAWVARRGAVGVGDGTAVRAASATVGVGDSGGAQSRVSP